MRLCRLAVVDHEHFRTYVFIGANQTKVPTDFAETLQRMGPRAEYVRISGNGPNALDFHISFYIGQLAAADPKGFFHITISALFQKQLPEKELEALVMALQKHALIAIDDKKVTYSLP